MKVKVSMIFETQQNLKWIKWNKGEKTNKLRSKPYQQKRSQQFQQFLTYKANPINKPEINSSNHAGTFSRGERGVFVGRRPPSPPPAPCTSYKTNHINKPEVNSSNNSYDLQKQTPSTNQKSTVPPDPRTYKANPINKPEINSSNKPKGTGFTSFEKVHTHTLIFEAPLRDLV